ncbi:uncharacterized protein LOC132727053 [Ruditapes philippinarum]|uniref:uncharacterized protein LOC132727053 n=1 Tax=Ruditapes philippinarum TaxID=129788 RepID=UPI00295AF3B0|nr:uncharacterized protein LOC132727053 [Ruditapes philippinarum]
MVTSACLAVICFAWITVTMPTANAHCVCPLIYVPVCSVDGVTYYNLCFLKCVWAILLHNGPCINLRKRSAVSPQPTVEPKDIHNLPTSVWRRWYNLRQRLQ